MTSTGMFFIVGIPNKCFYTKVGQVTNWIRSTGPVRQENQIDRDFPASVNRCLRLTVNRESPGFYRVGQELIAV